MTAALTRYTPLLSSWQGRMGKDGKVRYEVTIYDANGDAVATIAALNKHGAAEIHHAIECHAASIEAVDQC